MKHRLFKIYKDNKEIGLAEIYNYPEPESLQNTKLENWDFAICDYDGDSKKYKYIIADNRKIPMIIYLSSKLPDNV